MKCFRAIFDSEAVSFWQGKHIQTDAELAEVLRMVLESPLRTIPEILRTSISLIMTPERYLIMTASLHIQAIFERSLRSGI